MNTEPKLYFYGGVYSTWELMPAGSRHRYTLQISNTDEYLNFRLVDLETSRIMAEQHVLPLDLFHTLPKIQDSVGNMENMLAGLVDRLARVNLELKK